MRLHCELQHLDVQVSDKRAAQLQWGAEVLVARGEGEGAFWDKKRKFRWR